MKAVFPVDPKLDLLGVDAEAAPVGGPRHFSRMLLGELPEAAFQLLPASQRPALLGNGGTDLAVARPAVEVGVYVGRLQLRYRPSTRTWRRSVFQWKQRAALGFDCSSIPFLLSALVKKQKPRSSARFTRTMRTLGLPSEVEVARAAALASFGSLASASFSHRPKSSSGSSNSRCASIHVSMVASDSDPMASHENEDSMLTEEQVRALLSYEELIPAIRKALMDFSAGRVQQPVRTIIPVCTMAAGSGSCLRSTAR